jgi:uncharacterized membrane protein
MAGDEDPPSDSEEDWRRQHGYRLAGEDFGRILALSDGVFAFAMTLLVISLVVPGAPGSTLAMAHTSGRLFADLGQDWPAILGFVFAFVMIGVWWVVHNRTFQYIRRYDSGLVWINMIILAQISLMPFVLGVYNTYSGTAAAQPAVVLFAAIQVTLGLSNTLLWAYSRRQGLLKTNVPDSVTDFYTKRGLLTSAVFAISIALSFVNVTLAQVVWVAVFVTQRFSSPTPEKKIEKYSTLEVR